MKKISFVIIAFYMLLSACTKDFNDLNINTKAATNVPPSTLFTTGEKRLVDYYTSTSVSSAPFRVISQVWTENSYVYEAQYNFSAYQAQNGWWNNLYEGCLANLQAAKTKFYTDISDPEIAKNNARITDILEVFAYDLLLNTYGNIPYSESLNSTIPFPKYDDAPTIYADLLHRLDTCIAGLSSTSAGAFVGSEGADLIYGADISAWIKFAASLELKMGVRLAAVDASTATSAVNNAVATGVFTSNADNAAMTYDPSSPSNSNPIWQALVYSGRHDFIPANLLVSTMVGLNDPRVPLYFTKDQNGNYSGGTPGNANGWGLFSHPSDQMLTADYPGILLGYWQVEFWLAEAIESGINVGGTAETHYDNAITASIEYWGGSGSDASAYLAEPDVNYATATGPWQRKLGYQEWIADYNMNWDSWTDIRRLGYPDIDVVSPPVGANGNLPLRLTYPANESGSNPTNWKAAVSALPGGDDVVSAKLFWEP
ncbi:MAG: SusD/RagB family nutrient-binding outer membrane lipoprotein [Bacteroidetes bacterium]|nr:SusD/RagB family nutrient-binding outer membrane lipoprotein [Bacteroidota bacterium]